MQNYDKLLSPAYWRKVTPQIIVAFAILGVFNLVDWLFS